MVMNENTIRKLEFDKVRELLAQRCCSSMGADLARALMPSRELSEIRQRQRETAEAASFVQRTGVNPMRGFDDIRDIVSRARMGAVLSIAELNMAAGTLGISRFIKLKLEKECGSQELIAQIAYGLVDLRGTEEEIKRCILSDEEIHDNASEELAKIRRQIRVCHSRIRDRLESLIRSQSAAKILQEPIITIRAGRYVVPVRQECRGQMPGLIHDQSGSGSTLFIEPMAVVEINNELREWEARQREEIERILRALTAMLARNGDEIAVALTTLATLDFIFAKGVLALDMDAVEPVMNSEGRLRVRRGRHPLIPREQVVPVDFWLGGEFTSLIITGPNTGGKTVTLKTCGLLALMAQAGLHVPGAEGCEFPVFSRIFADIGDEQSIEQSLSTFSSHMRNIVDTLREVDSDSLVLLDELGAGTDPTEGAALAISILERLTAMRVRTMATTHYSELKAYALSADSVDNASMEFDVETLRPTFRLTMGIPGKSNAFEISRRLGLDETLIERARQLMSKEAVRFEDVMENAEYHRAMAARERQVAEEARLEMEELKKQVAQQRARLEEQQRAILGKARDEARALVRRARQEAEAAIARLRTLQPESVPERERTIQEARDALRALEDETAERPAAARTGGVPLKPPTDLREGETVLLVDIDKQGTVLKPPNERGEVQVQVGVIRLTTRLSNLRRAERADAPEPAGTGRSFGLRTTVSAQLDIRGFDGQSGVQAVDLYLDEAFLAGLSEVSIIHGKGTGALRDAVWQFLRRHPHVDTYRLGQYGEGDAGVTVVKLK
jgi:DNA mismatch repair protein MutS2